MNSWAKQVFATQGIGYCHCRICCMHFCCSMFQRIRKQRQFALKTTATDTKKNALIHTCNHTQYKDNASLTVNRLAVVQLLCVVSLRFRNEMVISLVLCANCKRKANSLMATTSKNVTSILFN